MRKVGMAVLAMLLSLTALPARAAGGTVALIPAHVTNGAPGNEAVITEALRVNLERHGFRVLSPRKVEGELRAERLDLDTPLSISALTEFHDKIGADYVVYPRVLSVGKTVSAPNVQANIIVNVVGKSSTSFLHTRQVGKPFPTRGASPEEAVIGRTEAREAAAQLLEGFYAKAK